MASDADTDGTVAKVEFFADGAKIGEATNSPFSLTWSDPPLGPHSLRAVATDNEDGNGQSELINIIVYNAEGTPFVEITGPKDGAVVEGPTNLLVTAYANALNGVTNVQFLASGSAIGDAATSPYSVLWKAPFGSNGLTAVVFDANNVRGTSTVVSVFITIPPTNTVAPTIRTQMPPPYATVSNLTSITLVFSERVQNVDAGDLLINGIPATGLTGSGAIYTFTFPQPAYGEVEIAIAGGHGITDFGFPSNLPYNELSPDGRWDYDLIDKTAPTIAARTPAAGTAVTNLSQIHVTFSEAVSGVDAADLLVNGTPAFASSGGGATYTFNVSQPASGTVNVTWATNHGIADLADSPNAFNGTSANARWSFTLDASTPLVRSNSTWKFLKGTAEASTPADGWRQLGFDDSGWSNSLAPFYYGDPYNTVANPGTLLDDMRSNYTSIFLRQEFTVENVGAITNLLLNVQSDDGFIAWLNGVEVRRYNMAAGEIAYDGTASTTAPEPNQSGAAYIVYTLTNAVAALITGTNVLAVHAFNDNLTNSSDFGFNAQLYTFLTDASVAPPRLVQAAPPQGDVLYLTNLTVTFSEPVSGVEAGDLLVNGVPASGLSTDTDTTFTFSFAQPPYGAVVVSWATNHGIADFDVPPKPFDGLTILHYTLINPNSPRIASQTPLAGASVTNLTEITVTFTKAVTGVDASDLLVNGKPASTLASSDNTNYTFAFAQPPFGPVAIRWAANHGIQDLEVPPNDFDRTRFGGQWNYSLVDPAPSVTLVSPADNAAFLAPADITLRANATDNDGTITRVEFFESNQKLGEGTNAPFLLTVSNVLAGSYVFRAVATDNSGLMATSAPANILVLTSPPIALLRGPYLQVGTPTSGVVRWRTDLPSDSIVLYGTNPANLANVTLLDTATNEHVVPISGLQPDTQYFYSIGSSGQTLAKGPSYWFKTSPPPGSRKPTRLWVIGDAGTAGNGPPDRQASTRDAYYNLATTDRPADLWLMLGDNAYNSGLDTEYQRAVFDLYPATLRNLFLWPTIGNHETGQAFDIDDFPYLHIFTLPQNGEAGGIPSGSPRYYSFNYANIHFVCLDSMSSGRATNTAMVQWLISDLAAATADWTIAFFHHPPYTKGNHNSDAEAELIEIRQNILPILEANGVDLVLNGHSHCWERSYLLHGHYGDSSTLSASMKIDGGDGREDGTGAYRKNERGEGTVYTVAGNAGQVTGGSLDHPAHFLSLNELGSMVVDVSSAKIDVVFLATNGVFRDHYTLLKRGPTTPPEAPANLIARALGANDTALTWSDLADAEVGYVMERSINGTDFTRFATNAADTTSVLDHGLLADTTYFYRVRAFNAVGESDPASASVTTVAANSAPEAPSELLVSASNGAEAYRSQILLRWHDRSANEAGFLIERSADGNTFSPIGTVGANRTAYTDRNLASATAYFYRVRSFNPAGDSAPSNLDGEQTHPQSDIVLAGDSATFHAGVEGVPPIQYQWRFMDNALAGETNQTLTLSNVDTANEGAYSVVITDAKGSTLSNPAWLFVLWPPAIVQQPASRTNLIGSSASFGVVAEGSPPLFYQWRKNGSALSGAGQPQLTIAPVTAANQGDYDVVVMNDFGAVTSQVARLVVNTPPLAGPDLVYRLRNENLAVDIAELLANDSDPDGDPLSIIGVSSTSTRGGAITLNGHSVFYSPPSAGFSADDTFTYALGDGRGGLGFGLVTVSVTDNAAPVLASIPDLVAEVMRPLIFATVATDRDGSANKLTYSLDPGAPTNARIHPDTGVFRWVPTREQAPGTNLITVRVRDDGYPSLSSKMSFTVYVNDYLEMTAGSTVLNAGDNGSVPIDIFSSAELLDVQCQLHLAGERLTNLQIDPLAPEIATLSLQMTDPNTAALSFTATPGHSLQGTQHLARLRFTAVPGQTSAFVTLAISSMSSTRSAIGLTPTWLADDGRIAIISGQSLLEARLIDAGQRELTLYGKLGVAYTIESCTNFAPEGSWTFLQQVTLTNLFQTLPAGNPTSTAIFFRAKQ
jgi:hypothetical protein